MGPLLFAQIIEHIVLTCFTDIIDLQNKPLVVNSLGIIVLRAPLFSSAGKSNANVFNSAC